MIDRLRLIIAQLQEEIEVELAEKRKKFQYTITEKKRVIFDEGVLVRHRLLKMKISRFMREAKIGAIVTAPVIYSLIVPFALLDVMITVYQQVCFRAYRIPLVKRDEYVVMDRKYLGYLNWIEKLNCIYCEYGNGVLAYATEVASRTEQFWCPIKHARQAKGTHARYLDFIEYGDTENFREKLNVHREKCRACEMPCSDKKG